MSLTAQTAGCVRAVGLGAGEGEGPLKLCLCLPLKLKSNAQKGRQNAPVEGFCSGNRAACCTSFAKTRVRYCLTAIILKVCEDTAAGGKLFLRNN